jgi:hypothetical protein
MKLSDITALGRVPFDPSYATNWAIAALSVGVFLTWAVGRELDPDNDLSAFLGAGLATAALLLVEPPSLLLILWLLVVLRLVNRTVGLPARLLDTLGVLGLGAWLTWQGIWLAGLMTAAAFLLDGLLSPPLRRQLLASGLALILTGVLSIYRGGLARGGELSLAIAVSSGAVAALFLVVIATSRQAQAVGDATGEPLSPQRVQSAQLLALLIALLFAWWDGLAGVVALLPLWAAMIGVGLFRLGLLFFSRGRQF